MPSGKSGQAAEFGKLEVARAPRAVRALVGVPHGADGLTAVAVAASMCGYVLAGTDTVQARKPAKPKVKLSELWRLKR